MHYQRPPVNDKAKIASILFTIWLLYLLLTILAVAAGPSK